MISVIIPILFNFCSLFGVSCIYLYS